MWNYQQISQGFNDYPRAQYWIFNFQWLHESIRASPGNKEMNIRGIVGNGENAKPKGGFSFRVMLARLKYVQWVKNKFYWIFEQ